jgi:hypothetical protein
VASLLLAAPALAVAQSPGVESPGSTWSNLWKHVVDWLGNEWRVLGGGAGASGESTQGWKLDTPLCDKGSAIDRDGRCIDGTDAPSPPGGQLDTLQCDVGSAIDPNGHCYSAEREP